MSQSSHSNSVIYIEELFRCLQQSFLVEKWKGCPNKFFLLSSSLLSPFCFALYLITLGTQRTREAKNLFQKHLGAIEHAPENIFNCSHVINFGKFELSHHQVCFFSQQNGRKRIFVWVRIQPQGLCQPLWVGWVGGLLEKPSTAASITLRTKLLLVGYKQTSWSSC